MTGSSAAGRPSRSIVARQLDQPFDVALIRDLQARAERAALVHQRADRHVPALIHLADDVRHRHADVAEEHFVELRLAGHLPQRPHLDARRLHVHQHHGEALVLRHGGIGAHDQLAPVRRPAVAGPDLLPVDDE